MRLSNNVIIGPSSVRRLRGVALVEIAILFPVLMFVCLGAAEFGQFFFIRNAFSSAARDVARASCLNGASQTDPATVATATLAQADVTFNSSWMTITDLSNGGSTVTNVSQIPIGHTFQVTLAATYMSIPNAYRPLKAMTGVGVGNAKVCSASCTMIKD